MKVLKAWFVLCMLTPICGVLGRRQRLLRGMYVPCRILASNARFLLELRWSSSWSCKSKGEE